MPQYCEDCTTLLRLVYEDGLLTEPPALLRDSDEESMNSSVMSIQVPPTTTPLEVTLLPHPRYLGLLPGYNISVVLPLKALFVTLDLEPGTTVL